MAQENQPPASEKVTAPESADALRTAGLSHAWRALHHRNFRLFFGGQSISLIGTWMTRLATSWLVYRLTKSSLLLGTVGFAGQIPTFLLAPLAGVIVDRIDRRKVLVWTQALAMVQSLMLAWLTLSHRINIGEVVALSAFQGIVNAFDMPGRQSFSAAKLAANPAGEGPASRTCPVATVVIPDGGEGDLSDRKLRSKRPSRQSASSVGSVRGASKSAGCSE
jgi:hypothetical protein